MRRRAFLGQTGLAGLASVTATQQARASTSTTVTPTDSPHRLFGDTVTTLHFLDRWRFDVLESLTLRQGTPSWQRDATYCEPHIGALSAWPTVQHDPTTDRWRMWYSADWKPLQLMVAESQNGRDWTPSSQPLIQPDEGKRAPHHVFTLPDGSGGSVYVDPVASDGYPYKVFVHQRGSSVVQRARADTQHRWHGIARDEGLKKYIVEDYTLVSRDGLHWQPRRDMRWSSADWHPEPPIFGFFNRHQRRHSMTVRPGWGDRRQCVQSTNDFHHWSGPELILQPDALDEELIEYYGMPVFAYGDGYVGLPWVFHSQSSDPNRGFNRFCGPVDCQLAFSTDGKHFTKGLRSSFIRRNAPDEHGGGAIQPSSMVETEDELYFYSAATRLPHGRGSEARKREIKDNASILLHTLRKDGLMFVESSGDWGRFVTKPLVLIDEALTMNASAPTGEVLVQLTDLESRPINGFTFDDFAPLRYDDNLRFPLSWNNASIKTLSGQSVRIEVRMRHARMYAIRGQLHFIDAQDRWMLEDGKPLPELT